MTPAERIDAALSQALRACGVLVTCIVKRKITKRILINVATAWEEAAKTLRNVMGG